ncbi:MAG TPA: HypC/HybG/HupF family hydrogenase formation chaperone [Verrucomicrobiae bacterium]|jgi:hydrogenase maturation factor|nr:HypC/HybG/HupF family hydrogenase formation chaperone [Verrucomicrobiae bacterium]
MNLIYGEITEVFSDGEMPFGKIRVGGAFKKIPLALIENAACGDTVLVCDGVAIGKVKMERKENDSHVPGNSR